MDLPTISSISIETFCHATESLDKVQIAMQMFQESKFVDESPAQPKIQRLTGGYGNEIIILSLIINNTNQINYCVDKIGHGMPPNDLVTLMGELEKRINEKGDFHLRFDKQQVFKGNLALGSEDSIKLKVKFSRNIQNKKDWLQRIKDCIKNWFSDGI